MMRPIQKIHIEIYTTQAGDAPFLKWLESFKDRTIRYRIKERLDRMTLGNFGDYKPISDGVSELRLAFGAGYRIYFSQLKEKVVLLLYGGDKSTQKKDIKKAIVYWNDYLMR